MEYKQLADLEAAEQIVTAVPEVRLLVRVSLYNDEARLKVKYKQSADLEAAEQVVTAVLEVRLHCRSLTLYAGC